MNKRIGLHLVIYSLLLVGLSYLVYRVGGAAGRTTLIAGVAGGALCLVWGVRGMAGSGGKALPVLTLIPVNYLLISRALLAWSGGRVGSEAVLTTLLLALSLGMLLRIAWSGVVFDVAPGGTGKDAGTKSGAIGKGADDRDAGKRV